VPKANKIPAAVLEGVPALLDQGLNASEIANAFGCTVGTLRVKCSHMGISLRRRHSGKTATRYPPSTPAPSMASAAIASRLTLQLPAMVMEQLQQGATAKGLPISKLASMLLETVAREGLYEAVLDEDKNGAVSTISESGIR